MSGIEFNAWLLALAGIAVVSILAWAISLPIRNVSFVDSLWSLFFLLAAAIYAYSADTLGIPALVLVLLVALWAIRLAAHIGYRNWGEDEDHRYQKIRENNQPFWIKSLYIVFGLQGFLAWIISLPLLVGTLRTTEFGWVHVVATGLWTIGFLFEAVGDWQLLRFKSDPDNAGKVLDTGLWRYTRHPNYFGEFCIWWAYFLFALAAGGWWTIISPLLMSVLLLKVSGVSMLESTIEERRPKYAGYIKRTNAFFPGPPKKSGGVAQQHSEVSS